MDRFDMLARCICPVCGEIFTAFDDLHGHLMDHSDDGIVIAEDFIEECWELATMEEEIEEDQ